MPTPVSLAGDQVTYSPEWWLKRLLQRLRSRRAGLDEVAAFHGGRQPLAFASDRFQATFGSRYRRLPANFMPRVVDAERDRLGVVGFRYGDATESDEAVWAIWQANQLDAESQIAHELALVKGTAYVMVTPQNGAVPLITVEDPSETIVESAPGNRRRRAAALKVYADDDMRLRAYLFTPEWLYRFRSRTRRQDQGEAAYSLDSIAWETFAEEDGDFPIANPMGEVPIVPLVNHPTRDGAGTSEVVPVMGNQSAINKLRFDALVAAEAVAFPQRWFTNIDIPVDPDTGLDLAPFKPGLEVLWGVRRPTPEEVAEYGDKMPEPKFGQFDAADLQPYINMIREEVVQMASISATPYYQLVGPPTTVAPSGESIKASEAALVRKAGTASIHFGEGWEETMRLALLASNQGDLARQDGETMWADRETHNEAARTDSIIKQYQADLIPLQFAREQLGYSQQEIRRMDKLQAAEPPATNGTAPPGSTGDLLASIAS